MFLLVMLLGCALPESTPTPVEPTPAPMVGFEISSVRAQGLDGVAASAEVERVRTQLEACYLEQRVASPQTEGGSAFLLTTGEDGRVTRAADKSKEVAGEVTAVVDCLRTHLETLRFSGKGTVAVLLRFGMEGAP